MAKKSAGGGKSGGTNKVSRSAKNGKLTRKGLQDAASKKQSKPGDPPPNRKG